MPLKKTPMDLPVANGQVIAGRYVVSGVIGQGGMGIVLAGRHLELGERVAIKFLHKEHASHADRFFREARAAARIRSEHVVRIFDVGRLTTGEPYIVMEHLDGEDLDARCDRLGKLDVQFVADTLLEVCQALAEAHAAGIVHRDLKPANIFLAKSPGRDNLVKLLDFGVAKVPDGGAITKTASVLGSPIYMSPEQLLATRDVDARSDIWSLGVILYELLTGEYPFEGDSIVHLAMVIREKATPRARDLRPELPEGIDEIISTCLQKNRVDRYMDVGEFAEALADFASPAISLSVSRIKRIVEEKKERLALASTESTESGQPIGAETEGDDEDGADEADLKSTAQVDSYKDQMPASGREPMSNPSGASSGERSGPTSGAGQSPLAASLVAVSTSTNLAAAEEKRRRLRFMRFGLAGVALLGLGVLGRSLFLSSSAPADNKHGSLVAEAAALPPPTAPLSLTPLMEASAPTVAIPTASVAPVASPAVAVVSPAPRTKPVTPPAPKSAAPAAAPAPAPVATESCDPPYTIDENGIKKPKKHCR